MAKHSPGPWRAEGSDIIDARSDIVAIASPLLASSADACLIATAPALLQTLDALLAEYGCRGCHGVDNSGRHWVTCSWLAAANVARRARGEAEIAGDPEE